MRIHEIVFLPTGEVMSDGPYETADFDATALSGYIAWWRQSSSPAAGGVDTPAGRFDFRFTYAPLGHGLATFTLAGTPVLSLVLFSGQQSGEEAQLLEMFLSSMRNVNHVKSLAKEALPFDSIRSEAGRPLVASVFWPVIPPEQCEPLLGAASYVTAAFFLACGEPGV